MVVCSFGSNGHIAKVPIENRKLVHSVWYTTICLPEVIEKIRKTNHRRKIILYYDNSSCHTSLETTLFLEGKNVELVAHPPNSPHLATNVFINITINKKNHTVYDSRPLKMASTPSKNTFWKDPRQSA